MAEGTELIGTGENLFVTDKLEGTARWFSTTADVMSADDDELASTIAFVERGGMTFLSPIVGDVKAIVCIAGSREAHLAILSREYGTPCVTQADLAAEVNDGDSIILDLSDSSVAKLERRVVK